jgi:hypothetical integral membrane protein (TIGR02206 family)
MGWGGLMAARYKVILVAGFIALYGMQLAMSVILCQPDGIRLHAPVSGKPLPLSTTAVGDAWMKSGVAAISVRVSDRTSGAVWSVPAERDSIKYNGSPVTVLAAYRAKLSFPAAGTYALSAVARGADGVSMETSPREVAVSPVAVAREFVFGSAAHVVPILMVLAASILLPLLVKRCGSDALRDRIALGLSLALWVHEVVYEVNWFLIGAWTVGNALLLHMCGLAIMFLPLFYFAPDGRFRQYLFELLFFSGLGGAVQALFAPDIGMHGFPELKYFDYFFSHGTLIVGVVYAATLYRVSLTWKSLVRIFVGITVLTLAAYGLDRVFLLFPPYELGNYFIMGYPPPTGSIIDFFASVFGPSPRYLIGLELMGFVLLGVMYLPYPIGRMLRRRSATRQEAA